MELIDKADVVAEIKRLKKKNDVYNKHSHVADVCYKEILSAIDTLEVKEKDSLTPEEIKKICTIYDNLNQERKCATVLYNSDETFFNHVLMEYEVIAKKGE